MKKWFLAFLICYSSLLITGLPVFISRYINGGFIGYEDFYQLLKGAMLIFLLVFLYVKLINYKR